jgi:ATP-dependent RNA helicase DDX3X
MPPSSSGKADRFHLHYIPAIKRHHDDEAMDDDYASTHVSDDAEQDHFQMDELVKDDLDLELPTQVVGHVCAEVEWRDSSAPVDPTSAPVNLPSMPVHPRGHHSQWSDDHGRGKGSRKEGKNKDSLKGEKSKDGARDAGGNWYRRQDGRWNQPELTESEVFGEQASSAGIKFDKYDNIPIEVSGKCADEVAPIERWSEAGLPGSLVDNIRRCGFHHLTPVQKYSIPIVMSGRDLMASAQTGSGKTCAFMVPCLASLLRTGPPHASSGRQPRPCGLVLAPTRELAVQIHDASVKFSFRTGIRTCVIYGGASFGEQRRELEQGCDIIVATPGRLTQMFERKRVSLSLVHFLILDEADRMLDMGFEPQVRQIVEHTDMVLRKSDRQSMMFSATFQKEVQLMAVDFMRDYLFLTVGRVGAAAELVTQKLVYADAPEHKLRSLKNALKDHLPLGGLAVVFVQKKSGADDLEVTLYESGVKAAAIHGDRGQDERNAAMAAFKSGRSPVLVATDVVGRGLDIDNISLVINFDMPNQIDDYVHRIGRTGRGGRTGVAVSLINRGCRCLGELRDLLAEANQEIPDWYEDLCKERRVHHRHEVPSTRISKDSRKETEAAKSFGNSFGITGSADAWD